MDLRGVPKTEKIITIMCWSSGYLSSLYLNVSSGDHGLKTHLCVAKKKGSPAIQRNPENTEKRFLKSGQLLSPVWSDMGGAVHYRT